MDTENIEEELHVSRYIIIYKFLLGFSEVLLGLGIVIFGKKIFHIYLSFRSEELFEDPHDLLARLLSHIVPYIFEHQGYVVFVLLLIGIVKMIGSVGLFYKKHWGLDMLVILTFILLPFEAYSLVRHPSIYKVGFFIANIFISLYLVNFKPKHYFIRLHRRIKRRENN